jgi:NAD(P)H-dependent FMN reductase
VRCALTNGNPRMCQCHSERGVRRVPEEILWGERTMEIGRGYVAFTGLGLDEPFMSSAAPTPTADDTEPTLKIAVIIGSTRPGTVGKAAAQWTYEKTQRHSGAEFALLDIADFGLPLLDEPEPAMFKQPDEYIHEHTRTWSAAIASFDGYVFITPEYNHGTGGALKNAIDFLYHEWADKAAGFVGYGYTMGARAIEHLRLHMAALQVATIARRSGSRGSPNSTRPERSPRPKGRRRV